MISIRFIKALISFTFLLFITINSFAQKTNYFLHTIKQGETIEKIAEANSTTVSTLLNLNNLTAKSILRVGKNLKIPFIESSAKITALPTNVNINKDTPVTKQAELALKSDFFVHTIKPGETLSSIAKVNETTVGDIMRLNGMNEKSTLKVGGNINIPRNVNHHAQEVITVENVEAPKEKKTVKQISTQLVVNTTQAAVENDQVFVKQHTIKSGETLSVIAKTYNTTVGDIMRLNGMNGKSILKLGAKINLPNTDSNPPIISAPAKIDEKLGVATKPTSIIKKPQIPSVAIESGMSIIKHTVAKGDNLYRISKIYKTTEEQLMHWNGLKNDVVKPGQVLIVGEETAKSFSKITKDTIELINTIPVTKKVKSTVLFVSRDTNRVAGLKDSTLINKLDSTFTPKPPKTISNKLVKDSIKLISFEPKGNTINLTPEPIPKYAKYAEQEGFYAGYFDRKNISKNTMSGDAATFKSKSGWDDKKYYVLINDINQGTIVRITSSNNKSICAQVKGPLPNIKEDVGLLMRLNAAAADALGFQEGRFAVEVNY